MKTIIRSICRGIIALAILNEIRGFILAAPIIWGLYQTGGTIMVIWLAFCSLAGIVLSIIIPVYIAKKVEARL